MTISKSENTCGPHRTHRRYATVRGRKIFYCEAGYLFELADGQPDGGAEEHWRQTQPLYRSQRGSHSSARRTAENNQQNVTPVPARGALYADPGGIKDP
jgi:hypothetical protein